MVLRIFIQILITTEWEQHLVGQLSFIFFADFSHNFDIYWKKRNYYGFLEDISIVCQTNSKKFCDHSNCCSKEENSLKKRMQAYFVWRFWKGILWPSIWDSALDLLACYKVALTKLSSNSRPFLKFNGCGMACFRSQSLIKVASSAHAKKMVCFNKRKRSSWNRMKNWNEAYGPLLFIPCCWYYGK